MNTKKIFTIGEPCQENWEAMTPTEKGKYCDVCAKCVVDLRGKSQTEIKDLYIANEGNLCGTMSTSEYNESQKEVAKAQAKLEAAQPSIAAETEFSPSSQADLDTAASNTQKRFNISKAAIRRMQIFAASFIAAFGMFWNSTVKAQSHGIKTGKIAMPIGGKAFGTVTNNGKAVSNATVMASKDGENEIYETKTDEQGRFYFNHLSPGDWGFYASSGHFEGSAGRKIRQGSREAIKIKLEETIMMMGDVMPIEQIEETIQPEINEPIQVEEIELGKIIDIEEEIIEPIELGNVSVIEVEEIPECTSEPNEALQMLGGVSWIETTIEEPAELSEPILFEEESFIDGGISFVEVPIDEAIPVLEEVTPINPLEAHLIISDDPLIIPPYPEATVNPNNNSEEVGEPAEAPEIKIHTEDFAVTVKPVPTRSDFTIRIDKSISDKPIELLLFSTDGKLVRTGVINGSKGSTTRMDLSTLPAGVYFLKGLQNEYLFEEKVLKL